MVSDPLVTVIMSVYSESENWLSLSINSILNQTYKNFEFIIINDHPKRQDLRDILNAFSSKDSRIIIIENTENLGLTKSLNIGLKSSKGKYISRMDADDNSNPDRLESQISFMENHPEVGVCGTWVKYFDAKSRTYKRPTEDRALKNDFLNFNPFVHPTVVIRKSILTENNIFYNEEWKYAQDKQFWLDLIDWTKFANIPEILYNYRISSSQISSNNPEQIRCSNRTKLLYIKKEFGEEVHRIITEKPITLETIREVKSILGKSEAETTPVLIENLYLSLENYSPGIFLNCIFSGDVFRYKLGPIIILKMIKRTFSYNKKHMRLQVHGLS